MEGLSARSFEGFYEGWVAAPDADEHFRLLENSSHVVIALADDRVVGFVNALSDRVLAAYIPLLEVLPAYRGHGIGTELVERLMAEIGNLYMIDVMCDADVFPFYERLGFIAAGGGVVRNHGWRGET
jgi:GNAT superfamily N-acetyltransferase